MKHSLFILNVLLIIVLALACNLRTPTEPVPSAHTITEGCLDNDICVGKIVHPLNPDEVYVLEIKANEWVDTQWVKGPHVFPAVTWHSCGFRVGNNPVCLASWTENKDKIHISTMMYNQTESFIMHETIHARYCQLGDCDYGHKRNYNWNTVLF